MMSLRLLCGLGAVIWAHEVAAQTIVSVVSQGDSATRVFAQGIEGRQLTTFSGEAPPADDAVYDVHWDAPQGGLSRALTVNMQVIQVARSKPLTLQVAYEAGVRGRQVARFRITEAELRDYGDITAWRVKLMVDGRTVDQRVEGTWMGHTNGRRR